MRKHVLLVHRFTCTKYDRSAKPALFSLIGTTFGGDGQTTFALPDLRGRVPISSGQGPGLQNYDLGQVGGLAEVKLSLIAK
jgi:microcystin-dependent protein